MNYKGYFIVDENPAYYYENLPQFGEDGSRNWYVEKEDLKNLIKVIEGKEAELKEKGIKVRNIGVNITGMEETDYNDAQVTCELQWSEPENESDKKKRIESEKKRIDGMVKEKEEYQKDFECEKIRSEIMHLQSLGYKITKEE